MYEFCESIKHNLLNTTSIESITNHINELYVGKGSVKHVGNFSIEFDEKYVQESKSKSFDKTSTIKQPKATIGQVIDELKDKFQISDKEALVIRDICDYNIKDKDLSDKIKINFNQPSFIDKMRNEKIPSNIKKEFIKRDLEEFLENELYMKKGGIIHFMSDNIIYQIINDDNKSS